MGAATAKVATILYQVEVLIIDENGDVWDVRKDIGSMMGAQVKGTVQELVDASCAKALRDAQQEGK